MKKLGLLLLPILAITLVLGGNAFAQNVGDNSVYFVTYYSNANTSGAPDGTLRLINDGDQATAAPEGVENGTLWADIYVFDDSQEMISCCSCYVTSDGLLSESVNKELTSDTFTGRAEIQRGVIKIISSFGGTPEVPIPATGLRGWMTHIQATTNGIPTTKSGPDGSKGPWFVTETALADSNLTELEASNLGTVCSYGLSSIGSGYGYCGCTPEDYDF
jgi:hypothetical protein